MEIKSRRGVIVLIMSVIPAIHLFRPGSHFQEPFFTLYSGYFSDIVLPFGGYFLLCAAADKIPILENRLLKIGFTFLLPALAETCQYLGFPVLGSTFDPLDYLMYASGTVLAVVVDTQVFFRIFNFWRRQ